MAGAEQLVAEHLRDEAVAQPAGDGVRCRTALECPLGVREPGAEVGERRLEVEAGVGAVVVKFAHDLAQEFEARDEAVIVAARAAATDGDVGCGAEADRRRPDAPFDVAGDDVAPDPRRRAPVQHAGRLGRTNRSLDTEHAEPDRGLGALVAEDPVGGDVDPLRWEPSGRTGRFGEQAEHHRPAATVEVAQPVDRQDLDRGVGDAGIGERAADRLGDSAAGVDAGRQVVDPQQHPFWHRGHRGDARCRRSRGSGQRAGLDPDGAQRLHARRRPCGLQEDGEVLARLVQLFVERIGRAHRGRAYGFFRLLSRCVVTSARYGLFPGPRPRR